MTEKVLLKDMLFNTTKVEQIAGEIRRAYPSFKRNEFVRDAVRKFPELALKARISWIAECLKEHLPGDYVSKRHLLKTGMSTRALYPGEHNVEIQVNGKRSGKQSFHLNLDSRRSIHV